MVAWTISPTAEPTDVGILNLTWDAVATAPGAWSKLVVCYDPDIGAGADTSIIPLSCHDFAVTPDDGPETAFISAQAPQ